MVAISRCRGVCPSGQSPFGSEGRLLNWLMKRGLGTVEPARRLRGTKAPRREVYISRFFNTVKLSCSLYRVSTSELFDVVETPAHCSSGFSIPFILPCPSTAVPPRSPPLPRRGASLLPGSGTGDRISRRDLTRYAELIRLKTR